MISVVIPARGDARHLRRCLAALAVQQDAPKHEVIVVASDAACAAAGRAAGVRVLAPAQPLTPGAARNMGAQAASGNRLLFLDCRCEATPQWLAAAAKTTGVVGGARRPADDVDAWGWAQYLLEFCEFLPDAPGRRARFVPGGNLALPRSLALAHPFDEDAVAAEDVALGRRLQMSGRACRFDPTLTVTYHPRRGRAAVLAHLERRGQASAAARRRLGLAGAHLPAAMVAYDPCGASPG